MDAIRKITSAAFNTSAALRKVILPLRNVLAFNLADERITYKKELCVAIERSGVSVAYGTRFLSSVSVKGAKHYPSEDRAYPQPKEAASSVLLAINEFRAAGAGITLSIPKAWAVIKIAEFPVTVKKNLSDVIAYELDRLVPFSPEEAFYDFSITGETAEKITIVIAAAKADMLNGYREALGEAGLTVNRVTLNLMSLGALCHSLAKKKDFLFIGTDGDEYNGALFRAGSISGVANGRFSADDDTSRADTIAAEIKPLVAAAKKSNTAPQLFALLTGCRTALKERLRTSLAFPVSLLDEIDTGLNIPPGQKNLPYTAFGGVMESLRPGPQKFNLMSRGRHLKEKIPIGLSILLSALLIALWIVYLIAPIQVEKKRLGDIERQIRLRKSGMKDLETLNKEIDALNSEIETVSGFKENGPMTLTILRELTTILPTSVWLTRVRITQSTVEIEGNSSSASGILSKLESSKYFRKAEFSSPTFRDVRLGADHFNVRMEIRGSKEEKGAPRNNEKK